MSVLSTVCLAFAAVSVSSAETSLGLRRLLSLQGMTQFGDDIMRQVGDGDLGGDSLDEDDVREGPRGKDTSKDTSDPKPTKILGPNCRNQNDCTRGRYCVDKNADPMNERRRLPDAAPAFHQGKCVECYEDSHCGENAFCDSEQGYTCSKGICDFADCSKYDPFRKTPLPDSKCVPERTTVDLKHAGHGESKTADYYCKAPVTSCKLNPKVQAKCEVGVDNFTCGGDDSVNNSAEEGRLFWDRAGEFGLCTKNAGNDCAVDLEGAFVPKCDSLVYDACERPGSVWKVTPRSDDVDERTELTALPLCVRD